MESQFRIPATAQLSLNLGQSFGTSKHAQSLPAFCTRNPTASQVHTVLKREVEEVEQLTSWNSYTPKELLEQQQAAEYLHHYRAQYSEIDHFFTQRKSRNSLPALAGRSASDKHLLHMLEITKRRTDKQNQEQQFKEQAKFSKRYEDDLALKAGELQNVLDSLTEQRELLRRKNTVLREKLTEADNLIKSIRTSSTRQDNLLKSKMKTMRSEDLGYVFSKRSVCQLELVTKEQEYQESLVLLNSEIAKNSQETAVIDDKVKEVRQKLKIVNRNLVEHYRKILVEGADTRSEGLAWVVKALWKLDEKVEVDMFPPFLDLESIHVIIFIAQKSMEIGELSEYIAQIQNTTRLSLVSQSRSNASADLQSRLAALKRPIKTARAVVANPLFPDSLVPNDSASPLDTEETTGPGSQTKPIEERANGLKALIQRAQDQELRRVARECFMNNLEQKVKTSARQLLAAITGTEALSKIMPVITKEQKELADELRKTKTFFFAPRGK